MKTSRPSRKLSRYSAPVIGRVGTLDAPSAAPGIVAAVMASSYYATFLFFSRTYAKGAFSLRQHGTFLLLLVIFRPAGRKMTHKGKDSKSVACVSLIRK